MSETSLELRESECRKAAEAERRATGWQVYDQRFRNPVSSGVYRVSTPPAIKSRDPDWDPSYGFLSPQLGTRSTGLQRRWNAPLSSRNAPLSSRLAQPVTRNVDPTLTKHNHRNVDPLMRNDPRNSPLIYARNTPVHQQEIRTNGQPSLRNGGVKNTPPAVRSRRKEEQDRSRRKEEQDRSRRKEEQDLSRRKEEHERSRKETLERKLSNGRTVSPAQFSDSSVGSTFIYHKHSEDRTTENPYQTLTTPNKTYQSLRSPEKRSEIPVYIKTHTTPQHHSSPTPQHHTSSTPQHHPNTPTPQRNNVIQPSNLGIPYSSPAKIYSSSRVPLIKDYSSPARTTNPYSKDNNKDYSSPSMVAKHYSKENNKDYFSPSMVAKHYSKENNKDYSSPSMVAKHYSKEKNKDYSSPSMMVKDYASARVVSKDYSSPIKYGGQSTPHKYEDISSSSDYSAFVSPQKYEVVEPKDFSKSESYEFIQAQSTSEQRSTLRAQKKAGAEEKARNYVGLRNLPNMKRNETLERVVLREQQKSRSKDLFRKSCDLGAQENIYAEPSARHGLGKRSATQLEISRHQISESRPGFGKPTNHGSEYGKLENLGSRIPRLAESRIPRLHPAMTESTYPKTGPTTVSRPNPSAHVSGDSTGSPRDLTGSPRDNTGSEPAGSMTLKKGILWSQRKRIFSRWKEKYFMLTPDYLQCFKKGSSRISEMGSFDYKVRLTDIEKIELEDRRGYYTIKVHLRDEDMILLRRTEGAREWYTAINQAANISRERRKEMLSAREFWTRRQFTDTESLQNYVQRVQRGASETPSGIFHRRGGNYSPCSTPSPSPRLTSPRLTSPLAVELDSGIDSLLTSLSDTSSNYSHRRIISPR